MPRRGALAAARENEPKERHLRAETPDLTRLCGSHRDLSELRLDVVKRRTQFRISFRAPTRQPCPARKHHLVHVCLPGQQESDELPERIYVGARVRRRTIELLGWRKARRAVPLEGPPLCHCAG